MKVKIKLHSSLLIDGYSEPFSFSDSATARNIDGTPLIPASAIKGALRIEFEKLFSKVSHSLPDLCAGRSEKCPACEIFGCPGSEGKIKVTDGFLASKELEPFFTKEHKEKNIIKKEPTGKGYTNKFGVKINRTLRTAEDKCFYSKEIIPYFSGAVFESFIDDRYLSADEVDKLKTAAQNVKAIGSGRSSGMGHVELSVEDGNIENALEKLSYDMLDELTDIFVNVTAHENLHLGKIKNSSYFSGTLGHITGSTFRGALATALLKKIGKEAINTLQFNKVFASSNSAENIFTNLLPVDYHGRVSMVSPLTLLECKKEPDSHGFYDTLISRFVAKKIEEAGLNFIGYRESCPKKNCNGTLKPVNSIINSDKKKISVEKKINSKCGLNRILNCAEDEMLYSIELVKKGCLFTGMIKNVTKEALEYLKELNGTNVHVGGYRSKGIGNIKIELSSMTKTKPDELFRRIIEFNNKINACFDDIKGAYKHYSAKIDGFRSGAMDKKDFYICLTALSELVPEKPENKPEEIFGNSDEFECVDHNVSTCIFGGYDMASEKRKKMVLAIAPGSSFIFKSKSGVTLDNKMLEKLIILENIGVGINRNIGCGQVRVCDKIHLEGVI